MRYLKKKILLYKSIITNELEVMMLLWLQVAFANDYNLISEENIHTQTYPLYTEYEYSLPKINLQRRSIEVEISAQKYCITEHHYEQQWKVQEGNDGFRKRNHSRKYIHYDLSTCSKDESSSTELVSLNDEHILPTATGNTSKIDISNVELRVQEQRQNHVIQDHTLVFSIPFSYIGFLYLHDSALQNKKQSGFDIYIFSSNYSYNPITDDPQDLEKLIKKHNQYASHFLGDSYINLQSFSYGQEHILIQPSKKEVQLMQCSALSNYLNNYPSSLTTIIQQSEDWPCKDAIQKARSKMCDAFSTRPIGTRNNEELLLIYTYCPQYGDIKKLLVSQIQKDLQFGLFTQAKGRLIAFEKEIDEDWKKEQLEIIDSEQRTFFETKNNENRQKMAACLKRLSKPTLCNPTNLGWICNECGTDPDCPCCEYTMLERTEMCRQEINE